jgi:hypothetical protein
MTTLTEAARAALEALDLGRDIAAAAAADYHFAMEGHRPHRHKQMDDDVETIRTAADSLRAALAASEVQAEPVAWAYWHPRDDRFDGPDTVRRKSLGYFSDDTRRDWAAMGYQFEPLYAHPAAPEQPAQGVAAERRACPSHCCPVHGCKYGHDDCPVVAGTMAPTYSNNNGCEDCESDALASAPRVPQGWKLVPVEPSDAMVAAGKRQVHKSNGAGDKTLRVYRDMLAAAPQPEGDTP